ncbi:MAG: hypothetical protein M5Z89_25305 [Olivibacter sp.]|nr:hypothetical protein [Olivibacter sp. UJ_SKK_5.1]
MKIARKLALGFIFIYAIVLYNCSSESTNAKMQHNQRGLQVIADNKSPKSEADRLMIMADNPLRMWGSSQIGK